MISTVIFLAAHMFLQVELSSYCFMVSRAQNIRVDRSEVLYLDSNRLFAWHFVYNSSEVCVTLENQRR